MIVGTQSNDVVRSVRALFAQADYMVSFQITAAVSFEESGHSTFFTQALSSLQYRFTNFWIADIRSPQSFTIFWIGVSNRFGLNIVNSRSDYLGENVMPMPD